MNGTVRKRWIVYASAVLTGIAFLPVLPAQPAMASSVSVTLSIDHFQRFEVPDDGIGEEGEFFPEIRIGDDPAAPVERRAPIADDVFSPSADHFGAQKWVFTRTLPLRNDQTTIPVLIRVWDDDSALGFGDDRMDISPTNQDVELNLTYDLVTDAWQGDGVAPRSPCHGDANLGQTCAKGDGDPNFPDDGDGKIAELGFRLTTSQLPDFDHDGIPDLVELFGVKDTNGTMLADLPGRADPCRKTILLKTDFMVAPDHSHDPDKGAIAELVSAYDAAKVPAEPDCPFPGPHKAEGVDLVHLPGRAITEQTAMALDSTAYATARTNGLHFRLRPYTHYAILAHNLENAGRTSGICCDEVKDFIVTLGSWRLAGVSAGQNGLLETTPAGDDELGRGSEITPGPNGVLDSVVTGNDQPIGTSIFPGPGGEFETVRAGDDRELNMTVNVGPDRKIDTLANTVGTADDEQLYDLGTGRQYANLGTPRDQSGTIMHELGHALGLDHGGFEETNFKPNYLSIMNYAFEPGGIPIQPPPQRLVNVTSAHRRLDYSNVVLQQLEKSRLDESLGIGDGTDYTFWTDASRRTRFGQGNGPLNWNGNSNPVTGMAIIDPGTVNVNINARDDAPAPRSTLFGFRDWNNLRYRAGVLSSGVANTDYGSEIDAGTALRQEIEFFRAFDPDLTVKKTVDRADALPGDTLTYRVSMDNGGTGAATAIEVTDTLPGGGTATRTVPYLDAGKSAAETFTYEVPCTTADGVKLTNTATVTAKDAGGDPEVNTGDNTAEAATSVHAPVLALTKTAPATVNAGEAMAIDLKVDNTGGGTATQVSLTDTLPAEVHPTDTQPKASSVTRNADGTTTLTWSLGSLDGGASTTVRFTARSSLLFTAGAELPDTATASYRNANGCAYEPVTASAATRVTEVTPSRNPWPQLTWQLHGDRQSAELLARVQATDERFDGADGSVADGLLTRAEVRAVYGLSIRQSDLLRAQLLTAYLNLADRRINAATKIFSLVAAGLELKSVGQAARHGQATLLLPDDLGNLLRYGRSTTVLTEINLNLSERY